MGDIVLDDRMKYRPAHWCSDCLMRANHFAIQTEQAMSIPDRVAIFVRCDIAGRTMFYTKITSTTLNFVDVEQSAVKRFDQPMVCEKSLQVIQDGWLWVIFRSDVFLTGHNVVYLDSKFLGLR